MRDNETKLLRSLYRKSSRIIDLKINEICQVFEPELGKNKITHVIDSDNYELQRETLNGFQQQQASRCLELLSKFLDRDPRNLWS